MNLGSKVHRKLTILINLHSGNDNNFDDQGGVLWNGILNVATVDLNC
jgi:hypothetical protein